MRPDRFLKHLVDPIFKPHRTKEIFSYNPAEPQIRKDAEKIQIKVYCYDKQTVEYAEPATVEETFGYKERDRITWINIDGLRKAEVEKVAVRFGVHPLLLEDIMSIGQRPKMDEIEGTLYCLLNMLYYNSRHCSVEQEQISILLKENIVITFQEDANRDVFDGLREKLKLNNAKIRQRGADYLCYALLDVIVDHYFNVMEKLGDNIEDLEEEIIRRRNVRTLPKINSMRKELIVLKRNLAPVRDIVHGLLKSESDLLATENEKYFKDVYDHILQATEVAENYRDIMANLQDLYISQVNLKMNEVMKVMAIVTCLLAPATVIGGIFGMNFHTIPFAGDQWGFEITVGIMLVIPVIMLIIFKRRGWF